MKIACAATIILFLFSCKKQTVPLVNVPSGVVISNSRPLVTGDTVTYLALGDSYTYGPGVSVNETFPNQLAAQLRLGKYIAVDPIVIAGQGWTTNDLLTNITAAKITSQFSIVTLLIGVNDENKGVDVNSYRMHLDQLIGSAINYANGNANRVFVISIPEWWLTPFAAGMDTSKIKNDVSVFNDINKAEAGRAGTRYIDITALSAEAATDSSFTGPDKLHPTGKMYALWAQKIYENVIASFK